MRLFAGIDIGTYSSKGVLVSETGHVLAYAECEHSVSMPRNGWAEHDPEAVWWKDLCMISSALLRRANTRPEDIAAVGISAIAPCVVPVDAMGTPLRPAILYGIDTRAAEQIGVLNSELGTEWILRVNGSELSAQSAGPKILWLKDHEFATWQLAKTFHTSTSFLVQRLTGKSVIDHYTAAFFGPLYDLHGRQWAPRALEQICDSAKLPELRWTTEIAGTITREASAQTGLSEGTPVIVGTADAAAEAVSAGVFSPGDAMLMYGSSLFIISLTANLAQGGVFWPAPFLYPGSSALAGGMATTGSITEWFRNTLFSNGFSQAPGSADDRSGIGPSQTTPMERSSAFETLATEAAAIMPGSEGLVVLPYFSGERTPINDLAARGVIAGLTLRHTRGHLYRALLEGVAYGIRHNLEEMASVGTAPARLFSVGGGTKNRQWLQIVSDVTGKSQIVRRTIGAALGDAALAAIGTGFVDLDGIKRSWLGESEVVEPRAENRALYEDYYALYRSFYPGIAESVHRLATLGEKGRN